VFNSVVNRIDFHKVKYAHLYKSIRFTVTEDDSGVAGSGGQAMMI